MRRRYRPTLLVLTALALGTAPGVHGAEDIVPVLSDVLSRDLLETEALIESERSRNAALVSTLTAADATGIRRQYRGRAVTELSPQSAAIQALERNLGIQRSELNLNSARAALVEAEAIFDPTVALTATYAENQTFDRIENIADKDKQGTVGVDTDGDGIVDDQRILFNNVIIDALSFDQPREPGLFPTTEVASEAPPTDPDTGYTYLLEVLQELTWGANLSMELKLVDKERFFVNNEGSPTVSIGSFDQSLTLDLTGRFVTTLPLTKGHGEFSDTAVVVTLAEIGEQRSTDRVRSAINDTLRDVDLFYYDLVRAVLNLDITLANERQIAELVERTNRLFERQEITSRSKAQVDAESERVKQEVEQAWNAYFQASNALNELLDVDASQMFVPIGYTAMFDNDVRVQGAEEEFDPRDNPDYQVAERNLEAAVVLRDKGVVDARPDILGDVSISGQQNGSVFGHDLDEAFVHLRKPDRTVIAAGVTFNRPWGNRGLEANKERSALALSETEALLKSELNRISRELDDALVDYNGAQLRVSITERNLELAKLRYEKALSRQQTRGVTEFELIEQSGNLLDASRDLVVALIAKKQAESRLLAAAGVLAENHGERTAVNEIDRQRIAALTNRADFRYFGDQP